MILRYTLTLLTGAPFPFTLYMSEETKIKVVGVIVGCIVLTLMVWCAS